MTGAALAQQPPAAPPATVGFSSGITLVGEDDPEPNQDQGNQPTAPHTWWRTPAAESELQLLTVGAYEQAPQAQAAIALSFSNEFAADSGYADQLAVYANNSGQRIDGVWQRAADAKTLYFLLPAPGRYLVRVRAGLRDAQGHTFNYSLSGPVEIASEN